jgi:CHAD domain-containing protein
MANPDPIFKQLHGELITSLVACRARPDRKAVHSLRTTVRRVEALLLAVQSDHPRAATLQHSVKKVLLPLKRIRRAAGLVRDVDVQRGLLETIAQCQQHTKTEEEQKKLKADCGELDRHLRRRRKQLAKELASTAKEFEPTLEETLESAGSQLNPLDEIPFLTTARKLAAQSSMDLKEIKRGSLHRYRKQIKAARYLAEMDNPSVPAKRLAQRLKKMLDSIGRWHDWMLLGQEAKSAFGKHSILAKAVRAERNHTRTLAVRSVENLRKNCRRWSRCSLPVQLVS